MVPELERIRSTLNGYNTPDLLRQPAFVITKMQIRVTAAGLATLSHCFPIGHWHNKKRAGYQRSSVVPRTLASYTTLM
jgi:hypothetical protein